MRGYGTEDVKMKRILYATDFSENSRAALDYAKMFALRFKATVYMLHVVFLSQAAHEVEIEIAAPSLSRKAAERRLETLANDLRQCGISVETHIVEGLAGAVIPRSVVTYDVDLLVLGIHGLHHGLTYLLMGSTTELLLREASCPVLTIGAGVLSGFDINMDLDHVFLVSDLSPGFVPAASLALFLSRSFRVPARLGVWSPERVDENSPLERKMLEDHCKEMQGIMSGMPAEWCDPDYQAEHAMTTAKLVATASKEHNALIILAIHTLNSSFARLVLSRSSSPVITILRERRGGSE